ncbi:MAG: phospholipase D-like domain-containing protein [Candidatus Absconditabacteria bacterium]|nr:phospholipase D-like domain-containing protein [Candidatus Absconditabacteria bacterium]
MKKQQKIVLGWIGVIVFFIALGSGFGGIRFEQKAKPEIFSPSENRSQIQNITGKIFVSPTDIGFILDIFGKAKTNLYLQTYEFTEKRIRALFKQLLENNVNIKLIMEDKKYQQFKNTFKEIQSLFSGYDNFQIKSDKQMKTTYVHAKFALIDSGFLIQTANLTHSTFATNREYFFYSHHSGVFQSLATIFDKDWKGETIRYSDIHPNLLVCPVNCRAVLENLIESAKSSIIIENQYIEDPRLLLLLGDKISTLGTGNIHIQLPDTDKNKLLQQQLGKPIVTLIKKPYIHAKMMLIDNHILYLGSINFSTNSMDNNREIGILLTDSEIIKQFLAYFYQK